MSIEYYDEKGKVFTDIVSKVAVQATIQTTTHRMRGLLHEFSAVAQLQLLALNGTANVFDQVTLELKKISGSKPRKIG